MEDYIAGATSGVFQTLIGHPFDTYKVLIQNKKPISKINPMFGVTFPMMSGIISNSIVFGSNETLQKYNIPSLISGSISGILVSPVVYYFDILKLNRQVYQDKTNWKLLLNTKYGKTTTFFREFFAFGIYFQTFEIMKNNNYHTLIAGGMAGLTNWTFTYPLDVIRNREIALNINFNTAYNMGHFFKGYGVCACRAILVNSAGFYVFENTKKIL
uniref:Mitochondrial Basic Amino Acids Transporter-Like Isoform X2 n=1 Tax=Florenciella sp. virus SA2 TaxID=3240092 RepID=A0AB39JB89_9VIRU